MRGEVAEDHGEELHGDAIGFGAEAVAAQPLGGDDLHGRPAKRGVPLVAGLAVAGLQTASALEEGQVAGDARSLLLAGDAGPERVECGDETVAGSPLPFEVVVEVETGGFVPHEAVDRGGAVRSASGPERRFTRLVKQGRDRRRVHLHAVEQRVEANRVVVEDAGAEGAEARRGIEARFAHGAVGHIEEGREAVRGAVVEARDVVLGDLVRAVILAHAIIVSPALAVALAEERFGGGRIGAAVVAREAGLRRHVRLARPVFVVSANSGQGAPKPLRIAGALIDFEDHARQERRLRAREVIGAVRVQDLAVVHDLVEQVVGHILRQIQTAVAHQAEQDEVAVPAVHLIEASARHDVGARQVEKPRLLRFALRQGKHANARETFRDPRNVLALRNVQGHAPVRRHLGIVGRPLDGVVGARERGPGAADVVLNLRHGGAFGQQQNRKDSGEHP